MKKADLTMTDKSTKEEMNRPETAEQPTERLNKFVSANSDFARRKADEMISQGRVTVNNKVITDHGFRINPKSDEIRLDGERIREKTRKTYILLNKPAGYITTTDDEKNRKKVTDLIKTGEKVYPVGRLDYDTTGLLLLTNDGEFANAMMHPRMKITKTYIVSVSKPLELKHKIKLEKGIIIDGRKTLPAIISFINKNDTTNIRITIAEGRNRQVRRMFEHYGYFVRNLHRSAFGNLTLSGLAPGEWKRLSIQEVNKLKELTKHKNERTERTH